MDDAQLEEAIARCLAIGDVSRGDDLRGFEADALHALSASGCAEVRVRRTGDPRCLLVIEARAAHELGATIARVWSSMRYRAFEAHVLRTHTDSASLRFVTHTSGEPPLVVTGELVLRAATSRAP